MWRLGGNDALDFELFMLESLLLVLLVVPLVLFLPAFLPSLGVIGAGHGGCVGYPPIQLGARQAPRNNAPCSTWRITFVVDGRAKVALLGLSQAALFFDAG